MWLLLLELKGDYIITYMELHLKSREGTLIIGVMNVLGRNTRVLKKIKEAACHCVELFYFKIDRYYYVMAYQWTLDKEVGGVKCNLSCIKLSPHRNLSIFLITLH